MADLSDVTAYIASAVAAVVYPNGTASPSIAPVPVGYTNPADVRIFEGWPVPEQLDLDLAGQVMSGSPPVPTGRANGPVPNVSIYPLPGATAIPYQILDKTYVVTPVTLGLTVVVEGNAVTITGTPNAGEFVTIVADREYIFSCGGASASAVLAALLTAAQADYPTASLAGSTLTIPAEYSLVARQGGQATLGKVTHRQRQGVMVTVWAPDHNTRSVLAKAIDGALKQNLVVTLPDGTDALITYQSTTVTDESQNVTVYRRDLNFQVEYATLETFTGTTITAVGTTIQSGATDRQPEISLAS
jgi:hypothetical protein